MKLLLILCLAICGVANAASIPYSPEVDARFNAIERGTDAFRNIDGGNAKRTARATYDIAEHGGSVAAHGLGVYLPAKTIITRSWYQVVTPFRGADTGSSTVALSCEDANNIKTATEAYNAVGLVAGAANTGDPAQMVGSIGAECEITATVAGYAQTSGKIVVFVDYVVGE